MARKRDRIFALFGAVLFFLTSGVLTIAVIVQMYQDDNKSKNTANVNQEKSVDTLVGTKLQNFTPASQPESLHALPPTQN